MVPKAKTDVSKVSAEPHKHKPPTLRHVSCPTSQKAGQDEKGVPRELRESPKGLSLGKEVYPRWATPHPPTHSEVPEAEEQRWRTQRDLRGWKGKARGKPGDQGARLLGHSYLPCRVAGS